MSNRSVKAAICVCVLATLPGCVEMTQTLTLNPDGHGKMKLEILVPAYDFENMMMQGGEKKKEKSLEEIRKEEIVKLIVGATGVTAWKDVSVSWARDGRLNIVGTVYFDSLDELDKKAGPVGNDAMKPPQPTSNFKSSLRLVRQDDGTLRLSGKNQGLQEGFLKMNDNDKGEVDFSKMSDKEIEDYMLRQRVDYRKVRPLMTMMFGDLKVKTVVHLPGDVVAVKGFKKEGRTVTQIIDGNALLKLFDTNLMLDPGVIRKLGVSKNSKESIFLGDQAEMFGDPEVTIKPAAKDQFDYTQEMRAARAAYPALRKVLGIGEEVALPGEGK
jgi:hypothetical protein